MKTLIALFLLFLPQDDDNIQQLIDKLDAETIDEREAAQKELVKLGPAAAPLLKKAIEGAGDRMELKLRAEAALREIETAEKVKEVYREPKRYTVDAKDQTLQALLAGLDADVKFDLSGVDADQKVTITAKDATLFELLDAICAGRTDLTFEHPDAGLVKFQKEPHLPHPTTYAGPFRFRLLELSVTRKTTFKETTAELRVKVQPEFERYLKPFKNVDVEITKAVDDQGRELALSNEDDDVVNFAGGKIVIRGMGVPGMGGSVEPEYFFSFKGLSPAAKKIASIRGIAKYSFPLESTDIVFGTPARGDARESGDYTFKIERITKVGRVDITFTRKGKAEGRLEERIDTDSLVAVDEDGTTYKADSFGPGDMNSRVMVIGGGGDVEQPKTTTYQAQFPATMRNKTIKELRFRFITKAYEKAVPFEFKGVKLP